ncbi:MULTISPECIES: hypothetical protein [unclassified Paenibacillus]|uniref:hypothetical protein n=1 Tax=unclassified Paenibacillus TaxID=185978 RepID=UPI0025A03927|nr:hypothetical protein [Paenibacillus sp. S-12]
MSKITKVMAVVVCASVFLVAVPSPSQAASCGKKILDYTERNCFNGKTIIKRHYSQTCLYDNGKTDRKEWVETEFLDYCRDPN